MYTCNVYKDYKSKNKKTVKNATGPKKKNSFDQIKWKLWFYASLLSCNAHHTITLVLRVNISNTTWRLVIFNPNKESKTINLCSNNSWPAQVKKAPQENSCSSHEPQVLPCSSWTWSDCGRPPSVSSPHLSPLCWEPRLTWASVSGPPAPSDRAPENWS